MYFAPGPFSVFSTRVFLTSIIIQIISIYYIFSNENQPFSLNKIFYLFSLFFFGIAPLIQFYEGVTQFGARSIREKEYFYINTLIILIMFIYQSLYSIFYKIRIKDKLKNKILKFNIENKLDTKQTIFLISLSFTSFFIVFYANNFSFLSMLFRGGEFSNLNQMSSTRYLIIFRFFQPLTMICLLYYITSKSRNIITYFILTSLALITCAPTGMPRFSAAAMYIPLLLLVFPLLRKKNIFSVAFILGLLIIFPFLDNFRYFTGNTLQFGLNFNMFLEGHFDSYQNLVLIVSENIVTWGRQLLGVLFFWIPRTLWANKPIGSGGLLANDQGFIFNNVSCNYFAEGYINFGYLGIIIFIIIISFLTAKYDKIYWTVILNNTQNNFSIIYFVLLGMFFFILRGDLLSSFAYTIGFLISIWLTFKVARIDFK